MRAKDFGQRFLLFAWAIGCFHGECFHGPARADEPAAEAELIDLFNGSSLEGWDGDPQYWRVENGAIVGETTAEKSPKKNTFLIYRGGDYGDFELKLSYQVAGYNSGVQYRSVDNGNWSVAGYQCDFDTRHHKPKGQPDAAGIDKYTGMLYEEGRRGFLAQRGEVVIVRANPKRPKKAKVERIGSVGDAAELETHIKRNDWNELVVIARGNHFTHIINGHVMAMVFDEDATNRRASGLFALQLHKGPPMKLQVKDIRVRLLDKGKDGDDAETVRKVSQRFKMGDQSAAKQLDSATVTSGDANESTVSTQLKKKF